MLFIIIEKDGKRVKIEAPFRVYGSKEGIQAFIIKLRAQADLDSFGNGWINVDDKDEKITEPPVETFDKIFGK